MSNNNIEITKMTLSDLDNIQNNLISDFDDFWTINTFYDELNNENSYYLIAKINNEIVGFAGMKIILDEADIMNVVTKNTMRNNGIGFCILTHLINIAKEKNIHKLTLEVNEKNFSAIHLYNKLGFKQIAIREKYYNGVDTAIIMQLEI